MTPGAVVALEFTGLGPDHSFDMLLDPAGMSRVIRIDPLDSHIGRRMSLSGQAAELLAGLAEPPSAVLAHCTAARLAVRVAAAAPAARPAVVLLDPDPVSADYLGAEFAAICADLGGQPVTLPGTAGFERLTAMEAEFARLSGGLRAAYGGDADADELVDELLGRYSGWLRFLAAGTSAGPVHLASEVVVISSGDTQPCLDQIVTADLVTCLPGCVPGGSGMPLLTSPAARQAVQEILYRAPADSPNGPAARVAYERDRGRIDVPNVRPHATNT